MKKLMQTHAVTMIYFEGWNPFVLVLAKGFVNILDQGDYGSVVSSVVYNKPW